MDVKFECALKGCQVDADECASLSLKADAAGFAKCTACPRGKEIAKTANWRSLRRPRPRLMPSMPRTSMPRTSIPRTSSRPRNSPHPCVLQGSW